MQGRAADLHETQTAQVGLDRGKCVEPEPGDGGHHRRDGDPLPSDDRKAFGGSRVLGQDDGAADGEGADDAGAAEGEVELGGQRGEIHVVLGERHQLGGGPRLVGVVVVGARNEPGASVVPPESRKNATWSALCASAGSGGGVDGAQRAVLAARRVGRQAAVRGRGARRLKGEHPPQEGSSGRDVRGHRRVVEALGTSRGRRSRRPG